MERWLLGRGGHYREVADVERWPLWRGGHCREVAIVERWLLVHVKMYLYSHYSFIFVHTL